MVRNCIYTGEYFDTNRGCMNKFFAAVAFLLLVASFSVDKAVADESNPLQDYNRIQYILGRVCDVSKNGSENDIAKILKNAIKNKPPLATKIIASFVEKQKYENEAPEHGCAKRAVNIDAVINILLAGLQDSPNNDTLIAAVLDSYIPASGEGQHSNSSNNSSKKNLNDIKEKEDKDLWSLPKQNPNQTSPQ